MTSNQSSMTDISLENHPTEAESSSNTTKPTVKKKKSFRESLKDIYFEFCSNTTLHGFQYFGQQRPWKEVFFWIVVIVLTIYFCMSFIVKIYVRWSETPVIVSFSEKSTPIWSIPFPAVTICSETQRAKNFTDPTFIQLIESLETYVDEGKVFQPNFTASELEEILTLMHVCNFDYRYVPPTLNERLDYFAILDRMLPNFERYYYRCKWFGKEKECDELFRKVYTKDGVCYTFNSLKATDLYRENTVQYQQSVLEAESYPEMLNRPLTWMLEEGYTPESNLYTYPARVLSSGSDVGLDVVLQNFKSEEDYSCRGATQGLKILLHSPDDVPSVAKHFVRVAMDKEVLIAVKPKMITTSDDIAAYPPLKRQCYLQNERYLQFYKIYSQNNCERECLSNFTLNACGCVTFIMPRSPDLPICGEDRIECYDKAQEKLLYQQFSEGLKNQNLNDTTKYKSECNCLPACTSLDYETEISEGSFDLVNELKAFDDYESYYDKFPGGRMSLLRVYFKENQFITSKRSELYGATELLANFGGVIGLFMGFSILSVVEIIYHFTLRLWSNMNR